MGILEGKTVLVTGVLTADSLGFHVARIAQEEGATILLTGFGRARSLTERTARRLPTPVDVLELDVTSADDMNRAVDDVRARFGALDGLLHAVAFAPESCLGSGVLDTEWNDVATMLEISTYSLKQLAVAFAPLMDAAGGGSIVALDFDAAQAWPGYDWMGVAKAGLESLARYLARDLAPRGIRVNLVAAGPVRTVAAKSIPGFSQFEDAFAGRAPLGWDVHLDGDAVARASVALLSDWFPRTTGEIVHVDGGFHAVGV